MLAGELIDRARTILQDATSVRWPLKELCQWLNDGQREVVLKKPSATAATVTLPMREGTLQFLPDNFISLLRVTRNIGGRVVTVVSRDLMDAQNPDWHNTRPATGVRHFMFDEANPQAFYVYPPSDGRGEIEAVVSVSPVDVPVTGDPESLDSYQSPIALKDIYANALVDYVLYRAYSKDAQVAGATMRAAAHFNQFNSALDVKVVVDTNMSPNIKAGVGYSAGGVTNNA